MSVDETRKVIAQCNCGANFETEESWLLGRWRGAMSMCEDCRDAREIADLERQIAEKAEADRINNEKREALWRDICKDEFRLTSESGGQTSLVRMDLENPTWRKIADADFGPGLILRGLTSGRMKTRIAWRILRRQFEAGKSVMGMTAAQFGRECAKAGGENNVESWFEKLAAVQTLLIDDLGKPDWSSKTQAQFFDLIDERISVADRKTLITSNHSEESLSLRFAPEYRQYLMRRLDPEKFDVVEFG